MDKRGFYLKRKNYFREHIEDNAGKYILGIIIFLVGICIGVSFMAGIDIEKEQELVTYFASAAKGVNASFNSVLKVCLINNFKYIAVYFVMSLTVYSAWLCIAVVGAKGFVAGFTATFLIKNYGAHGVIYTLLAIAPATIIVLPVLLFASAVCINFAIERRKTGAMGMKPALGIVPALVVIYSVMAICSLYDVIIAPLVFKNLF